MQELSDEALIQQAGCGDRQAFAALVERHQRAVAHFVYRFLGSAGRDAVEDLVQDIFLGAWKAAPSYEPHAKVLTWLLRIATNTCLNYRRSRRLRRVLTLDDRDTVELSDSRTAPVEQAAMALEQAAQVRSAVAKLSPMQRAAILLRHFHGLPYTEIAEILEVSHSSVESLLFRARAKLRDALKSREMHADSPQVLPGLGA